MRKTTVFPENEGRKRVGLWIRVSTGMQVEGEEIVRRLKKLYPEPVVELDCTTPFELMVASILAA